MPENDLRTAASGAVSVLVGSFIVTLAAKGLGVLPDSILGYGQLVDMLAISFSAVVVIACSAAMLGLFLGEYVRWRKCKRVLDRWENSES